MDFPYDPSDDKPLTRRQRIIFIVIFAFIFAGIISIACVIGSLPRTPVQSAVDPDTPGYMSSSLPEVVRIHSRQEWGSHPSRFRRILNHPTPLVVISETATASCNNFWSCSEVVKAIQEHHMESSLSDIGYNFLVGGDGSVYEGRGWDTANVPTGFVRNCNIAIGFIGSFTKHHPPKKQVLNALQLLTLGVNIGKISADYKVLTVNQTAPVESLGHHLYNVIKLWSHYWIETEQDNVHCPSLA